MLIDLHTHIIVENTNMSEANIDWESVLNIARMALEDGIEHLVWTPEYRAGQINDVDVYRNELLLNAINLKLQEAGFPLTVSLGADFHLAINGRPFISDDIRQVTDSRYVLLSFSQVYASSNFETIIRHLLNQGYTPIIAHPERLSWVNEKYHVLRSLIDDGAWIQITADSFCGYFGRKAQYWAERFLSEGIVHVISSEAHCADKRPPVLSEARNFLELNLNPSEVHNIIYTRPQLVVNNQVCENGLLPPGVNLGWQTEKVS